MATRIVNLLKLVYEFLFKVRDLTFPLLLNNRKPRRSIVRYIGSILPLPTAPKVYLHLPAFQPSIDASTPTEIYSITTDDEEDSSKGTTVSDWSDAACSHDATIQQLQLELITLREQVAAILLKQTNTSPGSENKIQAAPPPPPPPPPPLPLPLLVPAGAQVTPMRPRKPLAALNDKGDPLSAVLNEMRKGRPKLKPIERSPGGRPVKPPKKASDPSDILTEVLKQRFLAVNFSPESDSSSSTDVVASEWKTCFI